MKAPHTAAECSDQNLERDGVVACSRFAEVDVLGH